VVEQAAPQVAIRKILRDRVVLHDFDKLRPHGGCGVHHRRSGAMVYEYGKRG
jgi:hypothetical protein